VKPEAVDDYLNLVSIHYPRIADDPNFKVKLFGSWNTEVGELDRFGMWIFSYSFSGSNFIIC